MSELKLQPPVASDDVICLPLPFRRLFRYHLPIDGSCLFRAVSEVLSGCQTKHQTIRHNCCNYILGNKKELAKDLDRNQNVEEYVQRLRDLQYPGGNSEMHILSKIYKVDFLVYYRPETVPVNVTHGGHEKKVRVLSRVDSIRFDSVQVRTRVEHVRRVRDAAKRREPPPPPSKHIVFRRRFCCAGRTTNNSISSIRSSISKR